MNIHEACRPDVPDTSENPSPLTAEAERGRELVGQLITDLNLLALNKHVTDPINPAEVAQASPIDADEVEEYIDPGVKAVQAYREELQKKITTYHQEVADADSISKTGKREKAKTLARSRILQEFRRVPNTYGSDLDNVIFSLPLFETVLDVFADEDQGDQDLYTGLVDETLEYCKKFPFRVLQQPDLVSVLIEWTQYDDHIGDVSQAVLQALFNRAGSPGQSALQTCYYLADASLELLNKPDALAAALDIYYLKSAVITDKKRFAQAMLRESWQSAAEDDVEATARHLQTAAVFSQTVRLVPSYTYEVEHVRQHAGGPQVVNGMFISQFPDKTQRLEVERRLVADGDIEDNIHHYDNVELTRIGGNADLSFMDRQFPERLAAATYALPLYARRIRNVAPAYLAHVLLLDCFQNLNLPPDDVAAYSVFPTAPATMVETYDFRPANEKRVDNSPSIPHAIAARAATVRALIDNGERPGITFDDAGAAHIRLLHGFFDTNPDDPSRPVFSLVRPVTLQDRHFSAGGHELSLSMATLQHRGLWSPQAGQLASIRAGYANRLQTEITRYPGRRPIRFKLPAEWQESGMRAINVKQDIDRRFLLVKVDHEDEPVELMVDQDYRLVSGLHRQPLEAGHTGDHLESLETFIMKLVTEWCCRPVIETSEGQLIKDERNPSRNPYLMYLGVVNGKKRKFQPPQAALYARDRTPTTGVTLLYESLRRRLEDPTGQQRNSTYVPERYDPRIGPLEVYLSEQALTV